jgi:histidine triad (HIT) family protein
MECIFCQIAKGKMPCYKIYEDKNYLAFLDIFPLTKGHTLVIPKKHYRWVWSVKPIGSYFEVCQKIAKHFQKVVGNNLVVSMIAGNEVPHAHIHLFPTIDNKRINNIILSTFTKKEKFNNNEAEELVEKLKLK